MLEFEKKVMLSEEEYCFLKDYLYAKGKTTVQRNYYYDTDDFALTRQGITCRIREKDGVCLATIKEHQIKGSDCSVETSCSVKDRYDDRIFSDMAISYQGCLETKRLTASPQAGIVVMLDQNSYLGMVDYELEIEYDKELAYRAEAELAKIMTRLIEKRILCAPKDFERYMSRCQNKAERFFKRLAEIERWLP